MTITTVNLSALRAVTMGLGGSFGEYTTMPDYGPQCGVWDSSNRIRSLMRFDLPGALANGTINSASLCLGNAYAHAADAYGDYGRSVLGIPANNTAFASQDILGTTLGSNVKYIADDQYVASGYGSAYDYSLPTYLGTTLTSIPLLNVDVLAMLTQAQSAGRLAGGSVQFAWRLMDRLYNYEYYYLQSFSGEYSNLTLTIDYTPAALWITGAAALRVGQAKTLTLNRTGTSGTINASLSQSSGSVLTIPSTVTIANGNSSQTFDVTGATAGTSTITATNGTDSATAAIDVVNLTSSLVSLWHLNEASGNAIDSWGSNTLTANASPGSTTGKLSDCRTFTSASSQYFSKASNSDLLTGNIDFTFAGWVYLSTVPSNNDAYSLITKDTNSPGSSRDFTIDFFRNDSSPSAGGFRFYLNGGGGGSPIVSSGYTAYSATGQWYHLVAWHDATADTINIEINGTLFSAGTGGTAPQTGSGEFRLGARQYSGFQNYLNGRLDEVAFWKRKLTTTERSYLFNSGDGNIVTDLAAGPVAAVLYQHRTRMAHL